MYFFFRGSSREEFYISQTFFSGKTKARPDGQSHGLDTKRHKMQNEDDLKSILPLEQWPKSGTPDQPIAVIGYPLNTQSHNDSGRHLVGRNHTASERSRRSIGCTRLWPNKSSKCTRFAYKPPDYGWTTRPPAHTHTRTRSRRELAPRHEAGHCLFFRLGALFPELFFVDPEVAVSTPTHSMQTV